MKFPATISLIRVFLFLGLGWLNLPAQDLKTIPVDSSAFVFSPGNWVGDDGRGGHQFRQTWNPYAYCRIAWESESAAAQARLLLDTSLYPTNFRAPVLSYCLDGIWNIGVTASNAIPLTDLAKGKKHHLTVYLQTSQQVMRWGSEGVGATNVLRVTGLEVNADSTPLADAPKEKWALIVGDSITEGCGATALAPYSYLVGQSLQTAGYEFGVNACGWSGWLNKGDNPPGDVPGYYVITNSVNGQGGEYLDSLSRWNKIDGNRHSLLDVAGHISAYGGKGQEPALILINYGTNDGLHKSNPSDTLASIIQCLSALRQSAPAAQIILIIPFGQYYAKELKHAVEVHRQTHPADTRVTCVDLGPDAARSLTPKNGALGGLHPNDRGHALFAARLIPQILSLVNAVPQ